MKKKFLGIALIAMSLVSFTGVAQNTTDNNSTVNVENVTGKKADKKDAKKGKRKFDKQCSPKCVNPYEGLNLTDAQKTQLQALNTKRMEQRKEQAQARKSEKQRNDSTRLEARKNARKEYLEEVKAIIGPDQYVVFLENMYVNGAGNHNGKAIQKGQRMGKHGMAHNRGDKGHRQRDGKNCQGQSMNNAQDTPNAQS